MEDIIYPDACTKTVTFSDTVFPDFPARATLEGRSFKGKKFLIFQPILREVTHT